MSLRSSAKKNPGKSPHRRVYIGAFTAHSHRLMALGYGSTRASVTKDTEEEVITQKIVEGVTELIEAKNAPEWMKRYTVFDNNPLPHPTRQGNERPRIDIEVRSNRGSPRPRFHFEAKRLLTNSHPAGKYLGDDGLGCFLSEQYAANSDEGGMLGYVQCDTCEKWAGKIGETIAENAEKHRLDKTAGWAAQSVIEELEHSYRTVHTRPTKGTITVYHTLLSFGDS